MFSDLTPESVVALRIRGWRGRGSRDVPRIALAPGRRPFLDPRKVVVVRETGREFGEWARQVGRVLAGEGFEQHLQPSKMLLGKLKDFLMFSAGVRFFAACRASELEVNRLFGFQRREPLEASSR